MATAKPEPVQTPRPGAAPNGVAAANGAKEKPIVVSPPAVPGIPPAKSGTKSPAPALRPAPPRLPDGTSAPLPAATAGASTIAAPPPIAQPAGSPSSTGDTAAENRDKALNGAPEANPEAIPEGEPAAPSEELIEAVRLAPPWLVSCIFHMGVMILLGLMTIHAKTEDVVPELTVVTPGDANANQTDEPTLGGPGPSNPDLGVPDAGSAASDATDVLSTGPPPGDLVKEGGTEAMTSLAVGALGPGGGIGGPGLGILLSGREGSVKGALLKAYGGNSVTEAAVGAGLGWLARQQYRLGSWSMRGPYADGGDTENAQAATGLALLAYQGAGYTPTSGDDPAYRQIVSKGWTSLLKHQQPDGSFFGRSAADRIIEHHNFYTQAICTLALCELYAMTHDPLYQERAQRAVDFLIKNQTPAGGWKYIPHRNNDLSVSGWVMMALQSARMAGLRVPEGNLYQFEKFLDSVQYDGGRQYHYEPGRSPSLAMTAEGLLSREFLGWKQDDPRLVEGAKRLSDHPINYRRDADVYYWYYATQVLHHLSGKAWDDWNKVMSVEVPGNQVRKGKEVGSWNPGGDRWAPSGRLFTTCMSLYLLEVYYRHLPIYSQHLDLTVTPPEATVKEK